MKYYKKGFFIFILAILSVLPNRVVFSQVTTGLIKKIALYQNPVLDADFPDPTVIRSSDGYFYGYATQTFANGISYNIQVARSPDLKTWHLLGEALPVKPVWANQTQNFFAPHVSQIGGTYFMYFSADPNTRTGLCLAVATATNPAGPFTDKGTPLKCGGGFVNIDPMQFDDPATGKKLLLLGQWFRAAQSSGISRKPNRFRPEFAADKFNQPDLRLKSGKLSKFGGRFVDNLSQRLLLPVFLRRRLLHHCPLRRVGSAFDECDRTLHGSAGEQRGNY